MHIVYVFHAMESSNYDERVAYEWKIERNLLQMEIFKTLIEFFLTFYQRSRLKENI